MAVSTKQRRVSQPLKWHGGKHYLSRNIIELFPRHIHYVEPYFGGGAVLFAKPQQFVEGHSEVVNDLYCDLINFWRVLQSENDFTGFMRIVSATAVGKPEWERAVKEPQLCPIDRAVAFFDAISPITTRTLGKDFATMSAFSYAAWDERAGLVVAFSH